jgi:acetoin utilization protein AcuB
MNIKDLNVEEYTSPHIITVTPNESLTRALLLMQENGIRHLPVVEEEKVVGMVSERDVLTFIGDDNMLIEDVMNRDLLSVNINDSLGEVAYRLSSERKGSALVLDNDGKMYGIFTTTDALNALVEIFLGEYKDN